MLFASGQEQQRGWPGRWALLWPRLCRLAIGPTPARKKSERRWSTTGSPTNLACGLQQASHPSTPSTPPWSHSPIPPSNATFHLCRQKPTPTVASNFTPILFIYLSWKPTRSRDLSNRCPLQFTRRIIACIAEHKVQIACIDAFPRHNARSVAPPSSVCSSSSSSRYVRCRCSASSALPTSCFASPHPPV